MRGIVFLNHRAGSTIFQHLCNHTPNFVNENKEHEKFTYPPATFSHQCHVEYIPIGRIVEEAAKEQRKDILLLTHTGNWWGEKPSSDIPGPYADPTPVKCSHYELQNLSNGGWRFFSLFRDGRNVIESLRRLKGGIEEKHQIRDPEDYFLSLCLSFRNKARIAVDCRDILLSYKILYFEDLINNPFSFMDGFIKELGFIPDISVLQKKSEQILERAVGKKHTSFSDDSKMHCRWRAWTTKERQTFMRVAGEEFSALGYSFGEGWV